MFLARKERIDNYELRIKNYELRINNYELRNFSSTKSITGSARGLYTIAFGFFSVIRYLNNLRGV
jgi:hypothetical protein